MGKRSTDDGNILVVGINGSGKSHFLAKSTLRTMDDPAVVLDIKGEMSSCYEILQHRGLARRSYIVFDPTNGGVHYDVYALLERDDPHLVQYVREIANAIIPMPLDVREPYWINMRLSTILKKGTTSLIPFCWCKLHLWPTYARRSWQVMYLSLRRSSVIFLP